MIKVRKTSLLLPIHEKPVETGSCFSSSISKMSACCIKYHTKLIRDKLFLLRVTHG